jgi:ADP-heptose:LPS heptosyltransferase
MSSVSTSRETTSVLFLQASGLGNSILLSPTLQRLHTSRPDWQVDLYVYRDLFGAPYEDSNIVDHIIVQDGYWPPSELRRTAYDISICAFPSNRWQYHALNRFVGADRRIAHDYTVGYWRTLRFLETDLVPAQPGLHDVVQNMQLLKPLNLELDHPPDPQFHLSTADRQEARHFLNKHGAKNKPLVGVHPGSGPLTWKRAPLVKFLELIEQKAPERSMILVFGGPEEQDLKNQARMRIEETLGFPCETVDLNIKTVAAVIDRCDQFISNDTGLSHVAAARKVPSQITIFHGTDPARTRPWRPDAELIQLKKNQMTYPFTATSP